MSKFQECFCYQGTTESNGDVEVPGVFMEKQLRGHMNKSNVAYVPPSSIEIAKRCTNQKRCIRADRPLPSGNEDQQNCAKDGRQFLLGYFGTDSELMSSSQEWMGTSGALHTLFANTFLQSE